LKKFYLYTLALLAAGLLFISPVSVEAADPPSAPDSIEACTSCHADIKPVEKIDISAMTDQMAIAVIAEASIEPKRSGVVESSRPLVGAINRICNTTYYGISKVPI
jgi:hypothetical protein